jgi:hypothetical protein
MPGGGARRIVTDLSPPTTTLPHTVPAEPWCGRHRDHACRAADMIQT